MSFNKAQAENVYGFDVSSGTELVSQLKALWHDKPDYMDLISMRPHRLRVLSGPAVDLSRSWVDERNLIRVSYVVGLDGKVEDARVLDTTSHRYNSLCLKTIEKWRFVPVQDPSGPVKVMGLENFFLYPKRR
ncbi:MAG: energy transducer TonB [Steroidobacteraceae bacterium]